MNETKDGESTSIVTGKKHIVLITQYSDKTETWIKTITLVNGLPSEGTGKSELLANMKEMANVDQVGCNFTYKLVSK